MVKLLAVSGVFVSVIMLMMCSDHFFIPLTRAFLLTELETKWSLVFVQCEWLLDTLEI
jgi:hypothetical protein